MHKIIKPAYAVEQPEIRARHNADENNNIQHSLAQWRNLDNKARVAEYLEHIPKMGEYKAKYAFESHNQIALNEAISCTNEHTYPDNKPKYKLCLWNFIYWVFS